MIAVQGLDADRVVCAACGLSMLLFRRNRIIFSGSVSELLKYVPWMFGGEEAGAGEDLAGIAMD